MNQFLTDLWHDLRQKRLAPVAIALALALLAVPVLLRKHADEPAPAPAPAPASASLPPELAAVQNGSTAQEDSKLDTFDPKNPFVPKKRKDAGATKALVPTGSLAGASAASSSSGSSAPSSGGSAPSGATLSSSGSAPSSGGGGGGGTAPAPTPSPTTKPPRPRAYTYVADLEFGRRGEERLRKGVQRLTILPSARNPLLVFLGISGDRKRAVFLVDSTASQSGEGTCRPDVRHCTFLYLSLAEGNDEHFLTDSEGTDYGLRLTGIRRVSLSSLRKRRTSSSARAASSRKAGSRRPITFFHLPLFVDEQQ